MLGRYFAMTAMGLTMFGLNLRMGLTIFRLNLRREFTMFGFYVNVRMAFTMFGRYAAQSEDETHYIRIGFRSLAPAQV